ncbi:hypothetical protein BDC45DRAFT_535114 [Circinella umbellata]|nr:hypothetical protein BDC45DRAFT_535114 [Circinella umbellata]
MHNNKTITGDNHDNVRNNKNNNTAIDVNTWISGVKNAKKKLKVTSTVSLSIYGISTSFEGGIISAFLAGIFKCGLLITSSWSHLGSYHLQGIGQVLATYLFNFESTIVLNVFDKNGMHGRQFVCVMLGYIIHIVEN